MILFSHCLDAMQPRRVKQRKKQICKMGFMKYLPIIRNPQYVIYSTPNN